MATQHLRRELSSKKLRKTVKPVVNSNKNTIIKEKLVAENGDKNFKNHLGQKFFFIFSTDTITHQNNLIFKPKIYTKGLIFENIEVIKNSFYHFL